MTWLQFIAGASLIAAGVIVLSLSVFGVFRFRYVLNRMHAAAMGDTLGILFVLGGLIVLSGFSALSLKLLLTIIMLWLTSPVSSHLIGRLEIHVNEKLNEHLKEVKH
ncbi:MAG: monovalent cation/H(+) antiporter subunit G [Clostridia bacterium]|nr:monovalent cation/H(+) antiporter subunit G [Clostridia bacterium]MBO4884537.1 monovalent cation/H(+) antiporter subunit G [Clostridia bacterium]MBR4443531.1 monovalent cation/H(+) antiporter subunit G [Clostridia bacterium]